jgi:1-acyl-sn-glycerol-3-phosphate acyltransferase
MLMRIFIWKLLPSLIKQYIRKIRGKHNLPKPPYILASNHASSLDPAIIAYVIKKETNTVPRFLGKKQHFTGYFKKRFHQEAKTIAIDRTSASSKTTKEAFNTVIKELNKGNIIGIFPEGGRSIDKNVHKARTGVARLALWAKVPVVPITLPQSHYVWPKNKLPRFRRTDVIIGKPLYFNKYYRKSNDPKTWRKITDYIMKQIARQGKLKYVDEKIRVD